MTKLIVAGCSVSDYTCVDKVWREYLSDQLTIPYMHEAVACGSNYRIWRKLSSHIINRTITPDDDVGYLSTLGHEDLANYVMEKLK